MNVASATTPMTRGSRSSTASLVSTNRALEPVTPNGNGASSSRMRCTSVAPWGENGSTSGTTESQVPRPASSGRNRGALLTHEGRGDDEAPVGEALDAGEPAEHLRELGVGDK